MLILAVAVGLGDGQPALGSHTPPLNTYRISGPAPDATLSVPDVKLEFYARTYSSSQLEVTYQCSLDGGRRLPCTSPKRYTLLDGPHEVRITARNPHEIEETPLIFKFTTATGLSGVAPWSAGGVLPPPLGQSSSASVRYVSTTGSDEGNPGTSSAPWRTIQHAMRQVSTPGHGIDQIVVRDGTYLGDAVGVPRYEMAISPKGTMDRPLTLRAENPGRAVIRSSVRLEGAAHFRMTGFKVSGGNEIGGAGIAVGNNLAVNFVEISYNDISGFRDLSQTAIRDRGAQGVFLGEKSNTNVYFIGNKVHHNGANWPYDHGFYLETGTEVVVANNVIYDTSKGFGIHVYGGNFDRSFILNNTIYKSQASGFVLASSAQAIDRPDNNLLINNLFARHSIDNATPVTCGYGNSDWCGNPNPDASGRAGQRSGTIGLGNVVRNNRDWMTERVPSYGYLAEATTFSANTVANPRFYDEFFRDLFIVQGSPMIGAAEKLGLELDANGQRRDEAPDIGAYEVG